MSTEAKTSQCEMHNEIMATDKFLDYGDLRKENNPKLF